MSKDDASAWKQKYFTSLEDLEAREKQLLETESLMRHSLTRLSLAAAGIDAALDEQLEKFRKRVRGGADNAQLQRLIDDISQTVKRIDQKQTFPPTPSRAVPPRGPPAPRLQNLIWRIQTSPRWKPGEPVVLRKKRGQRRRPAPRRDC
jgi:hypothetical protein